MKLDQAACLHALQLILIFAAVVTLGIITQNPLTMFGFLLMWSSPLFSSQSRKMKRKKSKLLAKLVS
jgi:hypothetical protein